MVKLALFFPCTHQEYHNKSLHNAARRLVDTNTHTLRKFDIFFVFNKSHARDYEDLKIFGNNSCVQNIYIHSLDLNSHEDIYIQPWKIKNTPTEIPKLGLSSGPNLSFYRGLEYLFDHKNNYSHILLLETDVFFLMNHWLDKIHSFCLHNKFSIAGSKYKGLNEGHKRGQYKDHLNGVAIYSNTPECKKILKKSEQVNEDFVKAGNHFLNFDIAIDIFRQLDKGELISGDHKFIDTDFIINCSDADSDAFLTKKDILNNFPNALLLHQKTSKSKNFALSFSDERHRYTVTSKQNFLSRFVGNEIPNCKKIPLFFHIPKNAGTFVNNTFLVYLRYKTRLHNTSVNFEPKLCASPIDCRIVDNFGNHIFNFYAIDINNIAKSDKNFKFKEGVTYDVNINSLSFDYLKNLDILSINVADVGFGYFEKLSEWFDRLKVQFVPFMFLREPFSRAKSLFTYLTSSGSSHEPTHQKIISETFSSYIGSEQCEDSWLIRSMLNLPDENGITDDDFSSILNLLSYFIISDLHHSKQTTYDIFSKHCSLNYEDIDKTWFNLVNKNARTNNFNIEFGDLSSSVQSQFKKRSYYDNRLYNQFIKTRTN